MDNTNAHQHNEHYLAANVGEKTNCNKGVSLPQNDRRKQLNTKKPDCDYQGVNSEKKGSIGQNATTKKSTSHF